MARRLVCMCNLVMEEEINSAFKKGAESTKDIQKLTHAGTSCGRCLPEIDALAEANKKKKPGNQQLLLGLGS